MKKRRVLGSAGEAVSLPGEEDDIVSTQIVEEDPVQRSNERAIQQTRATSDPGVWGLDPLYWTYLVLLNVHVTRGLLPRGTTWDEVNRERSRLQCNHMLPLSGRIVGHCQLVGALVRKQANSIFRTFTIDDGTALVDCVEWKNDDEAEGRGFDPIDPPLGASIRCFGRLDWPGTRFQTSFKQSVRRLVLTRPVVLIRNANEELRHWLRAMELWEGIYAEPLVLPQGTVSSTAGPEVRYVYGGPVEDLVMPIVRNTTGKMPLVSAVNESAVRSRFGPFFKILFEFRTLLREESVTALLLKLVSTEKSSIESILRLALKNLCFSGQIFMMDSKLDIYAVITHEDFLAPAILRAMVRFQSPFMPHKALLEKIREDPRLHTISRERFDSSLSRLMMENHIIEGDPGTFALFSAK